MLPECLHVAVSAVDEDAVRNYVGEVTKVVVGGTPSKALLVEVEPPSFIDQRLPIWKLKNARILHCRKQLWVHVDYRAYRYAYKKAFSDEDIRGKVMNRVLNRRVARLKGMNYLRITPISRSSNSSSAFSENWGFDLYSKPEEFASNKKKGKFIQYADLCDLMVMLDRKVGGGIMEIVNEGQKLVG